MGLAVLAVIAGLGLLVAFALRVLPRRLPPPPEVELPDPHAPIPDEENAWVPLADLLRRLLASHDPEVQRMLAPPRERAEYWRVRDGVAVLVPEVPLPEPPPHPEPGPAQVRPWRSSVDPWLDELAKVVERPRLVVPPPPWSTDPDDGFEDLVGNAVPSLVLRLLERAAAARRDGALGQALDDWVLVLRLSALLATAGSPFSAWHAHTYASKALRAMTDALAPLPEGFDPLHDDPRVYWPRQWSEGQRELWRGAVDRLRPWLEDDELLADVVAVRVWEEFAELNRREEERDARVPGSGLGARLLRLWFGLWEGPNQRCLTWQMWVLRTQAAVALEEGRRAPWAWRWAEVKRRVPQLKSAKRFVIVDQVAREAADALATLTNIRLRLLVIVLKVYQETHRRLPTTWEEVVADGLLTRVPLDPYDGQPVRYDAPRGVAWCIGERWQDVFEGGYDGRELFRLAAEAFPDPRQRAVARLPIEVVLPYITAARPAQGWWVSTIRSR